MLKSPVKQELRFLFFHFSFFFNDTATTEIYTLSLHDALPISFGSIGPGIATGAMTLLVLIFGEITPKSLAVAHNDRISLMVAKPIYLLSIALFPLVYVFENLSRLAVKAFGAKKSPATLTHEELKAMVSLGVQEGAIGHDEKTMIQGVLKLEYKDVHQVMTPRNRIFSLDMNLKINDVVEKIMASGFSRVPVYDRKSTNLKGIVYVKDIMEVLHKKKNPKLSEIMIKPFIVPELKKIDDLLSEFKKRKKHIALVVDEHGDISGLVRSEERRVGKECRSRWSPDH